MGLTREEAGAISADMEAAHPGVGTSLDEAFARLKVAHNQEAKDRVRLEIVALIQESSVSGQETP